MFDAKTKKLYRILDSTKDSNKTRIADIGTRKKGRGQRRGEKKGRGRARVSEREREINVSDGWDGNDSPPHF